MSNQNRKLVAVSVNQIRTLTSSDHNLVIQRQKINQCCIVGNVLSINEASTKTSYIITDYTAKAIEVVVWKNSGEEGRTMRMTAPIMEQTYVRAYGQPRKNADDIMFVAFNIQPLSNLNDLTIHLLEVSKHAKDLKKLKTELMCGNKAGGDCAFASNGDGFARSTLSGGNGPKVAGFTQIQNLVMNVIKTSENEIGINIQTISNSLRTVKKEVIREAIDFLLNEGNHNDSFANQVQSFVQTIID